jgi:hypothetical protein
MVATVVLSPPFFFAAQFFLILARSGKQLAGFARVEVLEFLALPIGLQESGPSGD